MSSAKQPTSSIIVRLVRAPISVAQWTESLSDPDTGAQGWFAGVTRRKTGDGSGDFRTTQTLYYEAHEAMAIKQLHEIASEAKSRFHLSRVVVIHRMGEVPIGLASVLVGCSSAHRRETFEAIPWIMDRLKTDVPIWKRETYVDESTEWIHP